MMTRMTAEQFNAALEALGMGLGEVAATLGVSLRAVYFWREGRNPVPGPVAVTLRLLSRPGNPLDKCRKCGDLRANHLSYGDGSHRFTSKLSKVGSGPTRVCPWCSGTGNMAAI